VTRKAAPRPGRPRRRSRLIGRLVVILLILCASWYGWQRAQGPSIWVKFQEGLPFTLLVPDPVPPGFTLDGDPKYEPAGPRQKVTRVTMNFQSGTDQGRFTLIEEALATGPPMPDPDTWGRRGSSETIGPYQVVLLDTSDGVAAHLKFGLTRVTIASPSLDRKQMRQLIAVLVTAR